MQAFKLQTLIVNLIQLPATHPENFYPLKLCATPGVQEEQAI